MSKLPKQQKQKSIYPYGPAVGTGEVANSKKRGKDAAAPCPNCGVYSQIANRKSGKMGKGLSREFNRGPVKGGKK